MTEYEEMKEKFLSALRLMGFRMGDEFSIISECLDESMKEYSLIRLADIEELKHSNIGVLKEYLATKEIEGCSAGTIKNYKYVMTNFFESCRKDIKDVEAIDIRTWLMEYRNKRNISDVTLDKYREALSWFFQWCHSEGKLQSCPSRNIRPIKHDELERKHMSRLEFEIFRGACKTTYERAIVEFLYSTGFRVSELCNTKISDVNMRERTVRTIGKGRRERTSWINAKCYVELSKWMEERTDDSEYLFVTRREPHGKLSKISAERLLKDIQSRIPGQIQFDVTPHIIRHTAATHALESGMNIQEVQKFLGHTNIGTTMRYVHVSTDDVAMAHRKHVV